MRNLIHTCNEIALREGIPLIVSVANTDGHMVPHPAVRVDPAQAGTRVLTLSTDAGLVRGTVRVDGALRPAVGREAFHVGQAGALAFIAHLAGRQGVWSTRVGLTGILRNYGFYG